MSSENSLSIPVESIEGAIGAEKSSQPNTVLDQIIESIKIDLGIIQNPTTNVNQQTMLRVPEHVKQSNPEAYKPRVVSVGPVHHSQPQLQPMEAIKRRYAQNFIQKQSIDIAQLVYMTEHYEGQLRSDYGIDSSAIPSETFVKIMCIDSLFLAEFLSWTPEPGFYYGKWNNVIADLFLLENQIPFYYLSKFLPPRMLEKEPVLELCDEFLDNGPFCTGSFGYWPYQGEKHLLDRLRTRLAYPTNGVAPPEVTFYYSCPTISQLHRAGVKFVPDLDSSIELSFQRGTLKLPPLVLDHNTERYFVNLVASQLFADDYHASHYIALMDYFIDSSEDVRLLVERGILTNNLEDDSAAASLINEIGRSVPMNRGFRYCYLVKDLEAHCEKVWNSCRSRYLYEWKRDLKANYIGNPWKTLSVIAAVILLGLTVTQTVCSILQL